MRTVDPGQVPANRKLQFAIDCNREEQWRWLCHLGVIILMKKLVEMNCTPYIIRKQNGLFYTRQLRCCRYNLDDRNVETPVVCIAVQIWFQSIKWFVVFYRASEILCRIRSLMYFARGLRRYFFQWKREYSRRHEPKWKNGNVCCRIGESTHRVGK